MLTLFVNLMNLWMQTTQINYTLGLPLTYLYNKLIVQYSIRLVSYGKDTVNNK
ncbi:MAG: Uncharacterised protein [Chloroflexota bacterium]|jgi:hypothetical protein|nr:MAG: Uncharacterised protein [Chloroflexota bacterium]